MKLILSNAPAIRSGLREFIKSKQAGLDGSIHWGTDFLERLEPFAVSGKLLRGCVLCFAYEAFSGRKPDKAVLNAAMALELTHNALLVHDDIMDRDELRRGRPAMHRQYQIVAERAKLSDTTRIGNNMAMAGGDAALIMAFELLGESKAESRAGPEFYALFADQLLKTCAGQMQDIYVEAGKGMPSKKSIYELMAAKTASYTLALPLVMGAALAGEPRAALRKLEAIGIAGGTIFQIRDDELGVLGDTAKTGKPVGADIREGKKTLVYYYLSKLSSKPERAAIATIFGNPGITGQDIGYVQGLAKRLGIPELLLSEISPLRRKALAGIEKLAVSGRARDELRRLIDFCAERQF